MFLAAAILACLTGLLAGIPDVRDALPRGALAGGWVADGEAQVFTGEDLYVYIDGGADIYEEYGFQAVAVQDYLNPGGKSVSLEAFEMSDADAAFGMYSFKTTGKGKQVALGDGGQLEDYYLNFRKGRYLLTITGFDASPETVRGLMEVGEAADKALSAGKGGLPPLAGALPRGLGFAAESVKFVRGRLGLNNILPLASGVPFAFRAAVRGTYGSGELFVLDFEEPGQAERAFAAIGKTLAEGGAFHGFRKTGDVFEAAEEKGILVRTALSGGRVLMTIGLGPQESGSLMAAVR